MRSSFGRLGMEQYFVPELLGRHQEIGLPPAGAKTNELIAKHCILECLLSFILVLRNISYDWSVKKTRTAVGRPHLVRSSLFIPSPVF